MTGRRPLPAPAGWDPRAAAAVAGVLALLVVALQVIAEVHGWVPGDRFAKWFFDHSRTDPAIRIGERIGHLGLPPVAIGTVLTLAAYAWLTAGLRYAAMACAASTVVLASTSLKLVFGPSLLTTLYRPGASGTLPSGHTAYATAVFGFAAFLLWRQGHRFLAAAPALVVVAMGPARVASGAHWPSDVIAGYALGAAWLLIVLVVGLPARNDTGRGALTRRGPGRPPAARARSAGSRRSSSA